MWVEGERHRGEPFRLRSLQKDANEVLVTAVHAIENADRDAAGPPGRDAR
jgi:hypothetical protein